MPIVTTLHFHVYVLHCMHLLVRQLDRKLKLEARPSLESANKVCQTDYNAEAEGQSVKVMDRRVAGKDG